MGKFVSVVLIFVFMITISLSGCANVFYKDEQYKIEFAVVDADEKSPIGNASIVIDDGKDEFLLFTGQGGKVGISLFYGESRPETIKPAHISRPRYYPEDFNIWITKEGYETQNIRLQKSDFALTDTLRRYHLSVKILLTKQAV